VLFLTQKPPLARARAAVQSVELAHLTGWQGGSGMELVFLSGSNARRHEWMGVKHARERRRRWRMGNALNFTDLEER
jgi:hypothetical protein